MANNLQQGLKRRILYIQYTNPAGYPPLEHSSRILAETGWQVLFLGVGSWGSGTLQLKPHPNIQVLQLDHCPPGWSQKIHYLQYCLWVLIWAFYWQPQWLYVSDALVAPIGLILSYVSPAQLIYHEHDSLGRSRSGAWMSLRDYARRRLARRVAQCILPNSQRIANFESETGCTSRVVCVWNCPTQDEVSVLRPPRTDEEIWIIYHGSIVPQRLPVTVIDALAMLPPRVKLRVAGYETVGHMGYVRHLLDRVRQTGLTQRVEFLGSVPMRQDLLSWCQKSDIGLALMPLDSDDINVRHMTGASNKPFDYLACGLALLVSNRKDWEDMYVYAGYGQSCDPDDAISIAEALNWFLDHPTEMRAMGDRGQQKIITDWNYEKQFEPVFRRLNQSSC